MTPTEKDYLNQLTQNIKKLQDFVSLQKKVIVAQHQEIGTLSKSVRALNLQLKEEQRNVQTLRTARIIVPSNSEWQESHDRLVKLQREIQEAMNLLKLG